MNEPQFGAVLICDEVLQEANGKQIIIGVYGDEIIVPSIPYQIPISVWFEFIPKNTGKQSVFVKFTYDKKTIATIRLDVDVNKIGSFNISTPPIPLFGMSEAEVIVEGSTNEKRWKVLKRKNIRKGTIPGTQSFVETPPTA
jgi:hypothetical protein